MNLLALVIGMLGTVSTVLFSWIAYRTGLHRDARQEGARGGALLSDIEYIKRRTDDMLLEQRDIGKKLSVLSERITRVEESAKQAHRRIDTLMNRET